MAKKDYWDKFDEAHPEIREEAKAAVAAEMAKNPVRLFHSPEDIWEYISHDYPELANAKDWAVGWAGGKYRVAVLDQSHVNHTLKIDPKEIDHYQALKARAEAIMKQMKSEPPREEKDKDHDRER